MMSWLRLALFVGALAPGFSCAQEAPPGPPTPEQTLYQEALQSLAEGRKDDASNALRRLIEREPAHAGAWLDLALIQCGLGRADEAERLFANVETRFDPSREILELISEAREAGCDKWEPASSLSLTVSRGIDQNVNQGASNSTLVVQGSDGSVELPLLDDFLPKHDQYTGFTAEYLREVTANGSLGFVQYQLRRHDSLRQYDTAMLFAGIESPYRFGNWVVRTTGMLGLSTMGNHLYQRQGQAQVRVTPPLLRSSRTQLHVTGSVAHVAYETLENFNSDTYELRGLLTHRRGTLIASASAGLLSDRARDDRPGGNRHGNYVTLTLRTSMFWDSSGELGYTRQTWRGASPYSPELLIDQVRAQRTEVLRLALSRPFGKNHTVVLEGRAIRNRENISIFQYNNKQLQLSWQWHTP